MRQELLVLLWFLLAAFYPMPQGTAYPIASPAEMPHLDAPAARRRVPAAIPVSASGCLPDVQTGYRSPERDHSPLLLGMVEPFPPAFLIATCETDTVPFDVFTSMCQAVSFPATPRAPPFS